MILHKNYKSSGFTLIELLVVIAIISLLSSVVLASLNAARSKARDVRRMSDIKELQKALEFYYDKYGHYPDSTGCSPSAISVTWHCYSGLNVVNGFWIKDSQASGRTLSEFISKDPTDPQQVALTNWNPFVYNYGYWSTNAYGIVNNNHYILYFYLENPSASLEASDGFMAPSGACHDFLQAEHWDNNGHQNMPCNSLPQTNDGSIFWGR